MVKGYCVACAIYFVILKMFILPFIQSFSFLSFFFFFNAVMLWILNKMWGLVLTFCFSAPGLLRITRCRKKNLIINGFVAIYSNDWVDGTSFWTSIVFNSKQKWIGTNSFSMLCGYQVGWQKAEMGNQCFPFKVARSIIFEFEWLLSGLKIEHICFKQQFDFNNKKVMVRITI